MGTEAPGAELEPPSLLRFVDAEYPEVARAERREARVVLRLTIDAEGRVSESEVTESAGHGFDEAARRATLQFRFAPARRAGVPVPSRILYVFVLRPPDEPLPTGAIRGRVTLPPAPDAPGQRPAAGVTVALHAEGGERLTAMTDSHGHYLAEGLPSGRYRIHAHADGEGQAAGSVVVGAGQTAVATLQLLPLLPVDGDEPVEVTVRGHSESDRLRASAQAVQVLDTEAAQRQAADLGEVLARQQGVGVRRSGGLGSSTRLSLNGFTDDQIRFLLDGVPLEFSGYPFGIANVSVNVVDRAEIYRGVVPVRFGADALGGAVNLVTDDRMGQERGSASYQAGSFGTQRLSLSANHLHGTTGLFARIGAFLDYADNDYPIHVERLAPASVHRFHDGYRAAGANAEVGLVDRPWAKRFLLRMFITDYDKELQHDVVMTTPYGEVEFGELATGATLRHEVTFARHFTSDVVAGYSHAITELLDVGECVYDWFGQCVRGRPQPGEIDRRPGDRAPPRDVVLWEHNAFGRLNFGWQRYPQHALRLSLAPTYTTRTGDERRQADPTASDPLAARRDLFSLVSGVEYQVDLFGDRLENIVFIKDYYQHTRSQRSQADGTLRGGDTHRLGVGNALRYRFFGWLHAKASYERATRLPRPDEVFGNGVLIIENLDIEPEVSDNINVGMSANRLVTPAGTVRADLNGFLREARQLIVLLGEDWGLSYQNVFGARSVGVEGALGWTSPGDYLALDGNVTYLDFRNTSSRGTFGDFEGDRIPNRPYLFANGSARIQMRGVAAPRDELALTWTTRYVHEFFRGWEVGLRSSKDTVPSQLVHSLALTYLITGDPVVLSFAAEVQNLTDERAFDFFGVQRPGRATYLKVTAEL